MPKSPTKPHSKENPLKFKVAEPSPLMEFIMKKMDGISRTRVKHMLANGVVNVDGERTVSLTLHCSLA